MVKSDKEKTSNEFNFILWTKWIDEETRENIVKTISLINSKYYNNNSDKAKKWAFDLSERRLIAQLIRDYRMRSNCFGQIVLGV